jgi:hypothetical protein
MGLKIQNYNTYKLSDDVSNFFSVDIDEEKQESYEDLKMDIYTLDIDSEEKANILNKINSIPFTKSAKEKQKIIKEIEVFKEKYKL